MQNIDDLFQAPVAPDVPLALPPSDDALLIHMQRLWERYMTLTPIPLPRWYALSRS